MSSKRPPKKLNAAGLWDYALAALGRRALSGGEMRARLKLRAESDADIDTVVARLKESGYLNDRRFAESFVNWRLENQGLGRARVLRDLRTRRVAPAVAEEAVTQAYADKDEVALVEAFLARKYRNVSLPSYLREARHLASAYRRLRYAGFGAAVSIRVLRRYSSQADQLEEPEER